MNPSWTFRTLLIGLTLAGCLPGSATCCPLEQVTHVTRLTREDVLRAIGELAEQNAARLEGIDALLRCGALGDPGGRQAEERAHLMARLAMLNLHRFLYRFAADERVVYEADAAVLGELMKGFSEPLLFPVARLERVRMGRGRVCVRYDLSRLESGWTMMGGKRFRYRVRDLQIEGQPRRVLEVTYKSAMAGGIDLLLASHYGFEVEHLRGSEPAPYELFVGHGVDGGWVRKHGLHRPSAFMFWVSPQDELDASLPAVPLAGVALYIPGLKFRLPGFLPDIDLDDLRSLGLPMPILPVDGLRQRWRWRWLDREGPLDFGSWEGVGPIPPAVRARFPEDARDRCAGVLSARATCGAGPR